MHKITLIISAHRENGLCNAGELLKILRAIEPQVVFEEIRPSDFNSYCKHGVKSGLEAQAIAKYLDIKSCRRVPVDRYDVPENQIAEIKRDCDRVFDYVEQTSREYRLLNEETDESVRQYGFSHLNSLAFATVMKRISEIEDRAINETGDESLIRVLERWRHLIQSREREMIGVIYEYCRENAFDTGVFLVGAAHKMGMVEEIKKHSSAEANRIDWNFCPPDGAGHTIVALRLR